MGFESYLVMCLESLELKFSFISVEEDEVKQTLRVLGIMEQLTLKWKIIRKKM